MPRWQMPSDSPTPSVSRSIRCAVTGRNRHKSTRRFVGAFDLRVGSSNVFPHCFIVLFLPHLSNTAHHTPSTLPPPNHLDYNPGNRLASARYSSISAASSAVRSGFLPVLQRFFRFSSHFLTAYFQPPFRPMSRL